MRKVLIGKLFEEGCKNAKYFKGITQPIAEAMAKESGVEMAQDVIDGGGFMMAAGMAMGEKLVRNRYIATGVIIGTLGTLGVVKLLSNSKDKKDEE